MGCSVGAVKTGMKKQKANRVVLKMEQRPNKYEQYKRIHKRKFGIFQNFKKCFKNLKKLIDKAPPDGVI